MAGQVAAHRQVAPYTTKRAVVEDYCRRMPQAPALTLAKLIVKENKGLFPNVDAARCSVRDVFGLHGKEHMSFASPDLKRPPGVPRDPRPNLTPCLPDPIDLIPKWGIVDAACERCLALSDEQIPFHDRQAIELAVEWGKRFNPDLVLLNGDQADCVALSDFVKDPRLRNAAEEVLLVRQYLAWIREMFPRARIIWKKGNHEERWERYFWTRAPELWGLENLDFEEIYQTHDLGIELIGDKMPIRLGRLNVLHGHEYKGGSPLYPAKWLFGKTGENAMCGHFHRTHSHTERGLSNVVSTWSIGCLCRLRADWIPLNKWDQAFAAVEMDGIEFSMDVKKIVNGRVW